MDEHTSNPVRILFLIDTLGAGGAEIQTVYLLSQLDRNRFEPHVVTVFADTEDNPHHHRAALEALGIPIYTLNIPRHRRPIVRFMMALVRYTRLMWKIRPRMVQGVLHTSNLIARIGRLFTPRHFVIATIRSLYPPKRARTERLTAFLSNEIVVTSTVTRDHMIATAHSDPKKLRVIYPGVPYAHFSRNTNPQLRQEQFADASFLAVMVARIDPRKDHPTLLRALSLLHDDFPAGFKMVLIGAVSYDDTQGQVQSLIAEYNLGDVVVQLPETHDIVPYYHMADVVILPSNSEAFGLIVIEAFAAGTPMIVSSVVGRLETVKHGVNGWIFPTGDAEALAAVLKQAWAMPEDQRREMGRRAEETAKRFSVEAHTSKYMTMFDALSSE